MTREELMAKREVAAKAIRAFRQALTEGEVDAYLDREYPLPAPEPQQAQGPSGVTYRLTHLERDGDAHISQVGRNYEDWTIAWEDRATVAHLLCPFEDVVRATLEEMGAETVDCGPTWGKAVRGDNGSWPGFTREVAARLPAILKRLEAR